MVAAPVRQLWHPLPAEGADRVAASATTQHRLERVLRLHHGARLLLADGQGQRCPATWQGDVFVQCGDIESSTPRPTRLVLAAGLLKGERWDWLVEKVTELGVDRLVPLQLDHCVVRVDKARGAEKADRWRAVAIEAFEQCGRAFLPEVTAPTDLATWLRTERDAALCHCDERSLALPLDAFAAQPVAHTLAIVIGPEGGLSSAERAALDQVGAVAVTLGPDVLRAETAALAAVVIARAALGRCFEGQTHSTPESRRFS